MDLFDLLVPTFGQTVTGLSSQMKKALEWAKAEGQLPEDMLAARLAPDMKPLSSQVGYICNHVHDALSNLADVKYSPVPDQLLSMSEVQTHLTRTHEHVQGLKRSDFADAHNREVILLRANGDKFAMSGVEYARDWVLPQLYFHSVTAYDILRYGGVGLQKSDFIGHMVRHFQEK